MTPAFQPLDIRVNKIFKDNAKLLFEKNRLFYDGLNQHLKLKQARYNLIEHIYNVWYNDTIITKEIIMHGFKKASLSGVYQTNLEDDKITELYKKDLIDSNFEIVDDLINDIGIDANEIENENDNEEFENDNLIDNGDIELDMDEKKDEKINSEQIKKDIQKLEETFNINDEELMDIDLE